MLNMLQPVYVFIIFVLKRNVINVILGRDKKKRISSRPPRTKETRLSNHGSRHGSRTRQRKSSGPTRHSNPVFSISIEKDTDISNVGLLSDRPCEDIPLKLPNGTNHEEQADQADIK